MKHFFNFNLQGIKKQKLAKKKKKKPTKKSLFF